MRTNFVRVFASLLLVIFVAPQAIGQDVSDRKEEAKEDFEAHYHLGTMTPPNQPSMDIKYVMSMVDGEHQAWIVADANGQELKIEMMDLEMNEGMVTYNWSPPDGDVVIDCELEDDGEGGWAGECIDSIDGDVGMMTMGPMTAHDGDHDADHDADHNADHDADDDGDSVPTEDNDSDS